MLARLFVLAVTVAVLREEVTTEVVAAIWASYWLLRATQASSLAGLGGASVPPRLVPCRPESLNQAVARPSEVDDQRQRTVNAGTSIRRSAAVGPAAAQFAISDHHIYDI
jgi:hypothetical protein